MIERGPPAKPPAHSESKWQRRKGDSMPSESALNVPKKRADDERQELLDAEGKTWRTLGSLEAADKQIKQLKARLAEVEAAAETALQSANALRQEAETRRARGLLFRLRAAWRGKEKRVAP
jgi:hypothetical protein